jgi:hypothetical protein
MKASSLSMALVRASSPVLSGGVTGEDPPGTAGEGSSPASAADVALAAMVSSSSAATWDEKHAAGGDERSCGGGERCERQFRKSGGWFVGIYKINE